MMIVAVTGLCLLAQSDPAGTPEQLVLYRIARNYSRPAHVDPSLESMGLRSCNFGTRYGAVLVQLHRSFETGRGFENAYNALIKASALNGPAGSAEHLKALAASLKAAVYCKECKNGRVECGTCQGKGRIDQPCNVCNGVGRVRPSGAVGNTDVTVKCRNCDGMKIFKNAGCSACSKSGSTTCASCGGRPWPEVKCSAAGCKAGRVPCPTCQGKGTVTLKCPFCEGGRFRPAGAAGSSDVSVKCRNCELNGQQGNGTVKQDCAACQKTGQIHCDACGGAFGKKPGAGAGGSTSDVFSTDPCRECGGSGWPQSDKAIPCTKCLGLGVRLKPASDPLKVLD